MKNTGFSSKTADIYAEISVVFGIKLSTFSALFTYWNLAALVFTVIGCFHSAGNTCKLSSKWSWIDSELESVSNQSQFVDLVKGSYDFKIAHLAAKCKKMELQAEQEQEAQCLTAKEWTLVLKQQMQAMEFEYKEQMMQYKLKLAQIKIGQTPIIAGANFRQEDHLMTNMYPSNPSQDSFAFGTDAMSSTTLLSLHAADWGTPEVWGICTVIFIWCISCHKVYSIV